MAHELEHTPRRRAELGAELRTATGHCTRRLRPHVPATTPGSSQPTCVCTDDARAAARLQPRRLLQHEPGRRAATSPRTGTWPTATSSSSTPGGRSGASCSAERPDAAELHAGRRLQPELDEREEHGRARSATGVYDGDVHEPRELRRPVRHRARDRARHARASTAPSRPGRRTARRTRPSPCAASTPPATRPTRSSTRATSARPSTPAPSPTCGRTTRRRASYTPSTLHQFNSTGATNTITRNSTGNYTVHAARPGLRRRHGQGDRVQRRRATTARRRVVDASGADEHVEVRCFDSDRRARRLEVHAQLRRRHEHPRQRRRERLRLRRTTRPPSLHARLRPTNTTRPARRTRSPAPAPGATR